MHRYLFVNGPIFSMTAPVLRDGALLTEGDRIVFVGPREALSGHQRDEAVEVDLGGRALLPGLCDSHVHLVLAALQHSKVDLSKVDSIADLQAYVRERALEQERGEWIVGTGWEKRKLFVASKPSPQLLDEATREHPVFLVSKDLHSAWLNTAALKRFLALDEPPAKCKAEKDDGEYTGLIYEDTFELENALLPRATREQKAAALPPYIEYLWSHGITCVHNNEWAEDFELAQAYSLQSSTRVRVLWSFVFDTPERARAHRELLTTGVEGWLAAGGIKLFADGSLGSLTAAVNQPYLGTTERGLLNHDSERLDAWLRVIRELGTYALVHAIGDRAAEQVLDALAKQPPAPNGWDRLEHAQLLSERALSHPVIGRTVFSVQPSHLWGDRDIVHRQLDPSVLAHAYVYRTMLERGAALVFGSDAPVETVDPWKGICAAVTRLGVGDSQPFGAQEALTMEEALAAHTAFPARLHGRSFASGTLEAGQKADLVVLHEDPSRFDAWSGDGSGNVKADLTLLDGELVYEAAGS